MNSFGIGDYVTAIDPTQYPTPIRERFEAGMIARVIGADADGYLVQHIPLRTSAVDTLRMHASNMRPAGDVLNAGLYPMLVEANSLLRTAKAIADRQGEATNWLAYANKVQRALEAQHLVISDGMAEQAKTRRTVPVYSEPRVPLNIRLLATAGAIALTLVGLLLGAYAYFTGLI